MSPAPRTKPLQQVCRMAVAPVTVAMPIRKEIAEWDEYTRRTEAVESVEIRPRVSGYIDQISFKDGQRVKPADVLFMIDPRPYQDALDLANAQLNPWPPEHRHQRPLGKLPDS